ncbi:MAG: hypothetical protein JXB32_09145 [Deltaproteobacteria bacterium]|nr:hypothetical protein [Deltaproteobacteria bacterium]
MADPSPPPDSGRCPKHDFPLDSAGCALCRQEAAGQAYQGGGAPPAALVPRKRIDPAVAIVGGALTFAGCVLPLAFGGIAGLLAWLIFDTGVKLTLGIGLGAAILTLIGVFTSK